MAAAAGWALYELPSRHTVRTDAEAVTACAALAARVLQRGAGRLFRRARPKAAPVDRRPDRDRDRAPRPGPAIRAAPQRAAACAGVTVDTANRLQGREFDVTIVLHPLSGRRDATAFHLEAGPPVRAHLPPPARLHRRRPGRHPRTARRPPLHRTRAPNVPVKFPDGWEANQAVLSHLPQRKVSAL